MLTARKIFYSLMIIFFLLSPFKVAMAGEWGGAMVANLWLYTQERITYYMDRIVLAALKQAAADTMTSTVDAIVYGRSSGGAMYITNWEDYLYTAPQDEAALYLKDFLNTSVRGTAAVADYAAAETGQMGKSYATQLIDNVYTSIMGSANPQANAPQCDSPSQMFNNGSWRGYMAYTSSANCRPEGSELKARMAYQKQYDLKREVAKTQAEAYSGFRATTKNGQVITPGSIVKDIQSNVEDLGNKMLAAAESAPEVIIDAVVKRMAKSLAMGIGNAASGVQREITNPLASTRRDIENKIRVNGPGTVFKPKY
jgi:multidrug efflux pump subunit AcrA (membrane-fusion protein)